MSVCVKKRLEAESNDVCLFHLNCSSRESFNIYTLFLKSSSILLNLLLSSLTRHSEARDFKARDDKSHTGLNELRFRPVLVDQSSRIYAKYWFPNPN